MALDPAQMAASLSGIVENLPELLQTVQIITYVLLALFFGSIVVLGFRVYAPFWKKLLLRVGFGFLSLFSGIAISPFVPVQDNIIARMMQLDIIIGGVVSSVIFAISLFLISNGLSSVDTLRRAIERLHERLRKEQAKPKPKNKLSSPYFLAGIVLIALFLLFSAANFRGIPSMEQNILSEFGITAEDLASISDIAGDIQTSLPEGTEKITNECMDASLLLTKNTDKLGDLQEPYDNPQMKKSMEDASGETVISITSGQIEGTAIVIGITDAGSVCLATPNELCFCPLQAST